ncbi:MAG: hypothetical protein QXX08_05325 [Candidatus Bathyarchaeia archaeon]
MNSKVVRVKSWEEFKQLVIKHNPKDIAYRIEPGVPARHLTGLRLILPAVGAQYVFIDTASGDCLRETKIPLHRDKRGNVSIRDEDVIKFVKNEVKRENLNLYPYWTV